MYGDPFNMFHFTQEIEMQIQETEDDFIFKVIKPFIEGETGFCISKELLIRAITEYFDNHPEEKPKDGSANEKG